MSTSVGTKARKKQSALSKNDPLPDGDRALENALLALDNACIHLLDIRFAEDRNDTDGRYWQQRFVNIVTPVSLALMEYKGPRHFHYHYRHRDGDASVLHPILENPLDTLAKACKDALEQCYSQLVGIEEESIAASGAQLEAALVVFLQYYEAYTERAAQSVD